MEFDPRTELLRLAERLFRSVDSIRKTDWFSGRDVANIVLKGFADPSVMYGRLMATSVIFWLNPDDARSGKIQPSPSAERTFDLLWIAYEQWFTRGMGHYSEVLALVELFYRQLRWILIHKRNDREFHANLDFALAVLAERYLSQVRDLANQNFKDYHDDVEKILNEFKLLTSRDATQKEALKEILKEEEKKDEGKKEEERKEERRRKKQGTK
jgi:hypothetical protein